MKFIRSALAMVGIALVLAGCDTRTLDFRNAEIVNGEIFEKGANTAFTGKVTNVPDKVILQPQRGYNAFMIPVTLSYKRVNSEFLGKILFSEGLCIVKVTKGVLDGRVSCMQPKSTIEQYDMTFKKGALHGEFKLFDLTAEKGVAAKVTFEEGLLEGVQEIFSLGTTKVIYRTQWQRGLAQGLEESFDPTTGQTLSTVTYSKGKIDGEFIQYGGPENKVTYKSSYVSGMKNGVEQTFSATTGQLVTEKNWLAGKEEGPAKKWDANGMLTLDVIYRDGLMVRPDAVPARSGQAGADCVDQWIAAYQREKGGDAMTSQEQIGEWETWCKEGKRPA